MKELKAVLDSGLHAMDSGLRVLGSLFFASGSGIVDGISDSLNCIPNSKAQDLTNALKLSKLWSCFQIFAFFCMVGVKEISIITKVLKFTQT